MDYHWQKHKERYEKIVQFLMDLRQQAGE